MSSNFIVCDLFLDQRKRDVQEIRDKHSNKVPVSIANYSKHSNKVPVSIANYSFQCFLQVSSKQDVM